MIQAVQQEPHGAAKNKAARATAINHIFEILKQYNRGRVIFF